MCRYCALGKFISSHSILIMPSTLSVDMIMPILQMRKLKLREMKHLSQGDKAVNGTTFDPKAHSEVLNPNCWLEYSFFFLNLILFFPVFLGPHPWHMEVIRLGVELEL